MTDAFVGPRKPAKLTVSVARAERGAGFIERDTGVHLRALSEAEYCAFMKDRFGLIAIDFDKSEETFDEYWLTFIDDTAAAEFAIRYT